MIDVLTTTTTFNTEKILVGDAVQILYATGEKINGLISSINQLQLIVYYIPESNRMRSYRKLIVPINDVITGKLTISLLVPAH